MAPTPMTTTLERPPAARAPQVYGWRIPAAFRMRPVGWTERVGTKPVRPQEQSSDRDGANRQDSSVGAAAPVGFALDVGPMDGLAASPNCALADQSNRPVGAAAYGLAFAASRVASARDTGPITPQTLDIGPPSLLASPAASGEAESNGGLKRSLALEASAARPKAPMIAPPSLLAIGDPASWRPVPPAPSAPLHEASYAV